MKRLLALVLACAFVFSGCGSRTVSESPAEQLTPIGEGDLNFVGLDDPDLLRYVEDSVYSGLVMALNSEDYFVENVRAVYISNEYLEEVAYNSQSNIFFGYSLEELNQVFGDSRYLFTLGEDGRTTVREWTAYEDPYEQVIKNVAIGTGVILLCVTVSSVAGGAGAEAVSIMFAASAKSGTVFALSSAAFSALAAGIVKQMETGDFSLALEAAAQEGSESFKWGAMAGSISGSVDGVTLRGSALKGLTAREAAAIQRASRYPLSVIKEFASTKQFEDCRDAGLIPQMIDGQTALIRSIDLSYQDEAGCTNLKRMIQGLPPIDPVSGQPYQLRYIGEAKEAALAILTQEELLREGAGNIWKTVQSMVDASGKEIDWEKLCSQFWEKLADALQVTAD